MKAEFIPMGDQLWAWEIRDKQGYAFASSPWAYTRRRDAKRGLLRFLKGMKKGVEVPV